MTASDNTEKSKTLNIKVTNPSTIKLFNKLKNDEQSNNDFLLELLNCYQILIGETCSQERDEKLLKNMLHLSQSDTKSTLEEKQQKRDRKEQKLRKLFELQDNDPLSVNEWEIIKVAEKVSNKSLLDMCVEGRLLVAKNEIGRFTSEDGNKGKADDRLAQTLESMKSSGQKMSLNRLTQISGSNRQTVKDWCERNNISL